MKMIQDVPRKATVLAILALLFISGVSFAADEFYLPKTGEVFSYKDITPAIWDTDQM